MHISGSTFSSPVPAQATGTTHSQWRVSPSRTCVATPAWSISSSQKSCYFSVVGSSASWCHCCWCRRHADNTGHLERRAKATLPTVLEQTRTSAQRCGCKRCRVSRRMHWTVSIETMCHMDKVKCYVFNAQDGATRMWSPASCGQPTYILFSPAPFPLKVLLEQRPHPGTSEYRSCRP